MTSHSSMSRHGGENAAVTNRAYRLRRVVGIVARPHLIRVFGRPGIGGFTQWWEFYQLECGHELRHLRTFPPGWGRYGVNLSKPQIQDWAVDHWVGRRKRCPSCPQ